jgi:hypothetical protein
MLIGSAVMFLDAAINLAGQNKILLKLGHWK